jgi:hypothetical protein
MLEGHVFSLKVSPASKGSWRSRVWGRQDGKGGHLNNESWRSRGWGRRDGMGGHLINERNYAYKHGYGNDACKDGTG